MREAANLTSFDLHRKNSSVDIPPQSERRFGCFGFDTGPKRPDSMLVWDGIQFSLLPWSMYFGSFGKRGDEIVMHYHLATVTIQGKGLLPPPNYVPNPDEPKYLLEAIQRHKITFIEKSEIMRTDIPSYVENISVELRK